MYLYFAPMHCGFYINQMPRGDALSRFRLALEGKPQGPRKIAVRCHNEAHHRPPQEAGTYG